MKDIIFKCIKYLYYFSLLILLILYLFPGSLIGYILYEDLGKQPNIISDQLGTSINHFIYFFYLSFLGHICNGQKARFNNSSLFLFVLSIILEMTHFIIPNRAFEVSDLLANNTGVMIIYFLFKLKSRIINFKIKNRL